MSEAGVPATTRDAFYGGRLVLTQPARGHRSGTDAVLLAAAVGLGFTGSCYDIGSGVGAVGLGIALLRPGARVALVENDPATLALARANATAYGGPEAVTVSECDILDRADLRRALPARADMVVTNPPFHDANHTRPSPDPSRRAAHRLPEGVGLGDWLAACLDRLNEKGTVIAIVSATALPEVLDALSRPTGAITVKPIQPRRETPAHRILIRAAKSSRAPFTLAAPLVLHGSDGHFTQEADSLHRGDTALDW